jgi:hypothetical protein
VKTFTGDRVIPIYGYDNMSNRGNFLPLEQYYTSNFNLCQEKLFDSFIKCALVSQRGTLSFFYTTSFINKE